MDGWLVEVVIAFALGGVLKGAIGAGTPVVVVPILSITHGVPFAVAVFSIPALVSNVWQGWQFRADLLPGRFVLPMVVGAGVGTVAGSVLLATAPSDYLMLAVAASTLAYVGFRLARPGWRLGPAAAQRYVLPVGLVSGLLQGSAGISAPFSVTFLNAMRLPRGAFIGTISVFFLAMAVVQAPTLWGLGILTPDRVAISLIACLPLFAGMAAGGWLARYVHRDTFDRVVMGLLVIIALRLIWQAAAG